MSTDCNQSLNSKAAAMHDGKIPVYIVSLPADVERRGNLLRQFDKLPGFAPRVVTGVYGGALPDSALLHLVEDSRWSSRKGTIGCFLSHVSVWEKISRGPEPLSIVLEDDADASGLAEFGTLVRPDDAEVIFLNDQMSPERYSDAVLRTLPMIKALERLERDRIGSGAYGYALTVSGAQKLSRACQNDLFFGHLDGRLLRYATAPEDLALLSEGSWIGSIVTNHHSRRRPPAFGLVKGYTLSRPLVRHRRVESSRENVDNEQTLAG